MPLAVIDVYHQFHFEILQSLILNKGLDIRYIISGVNDNFHGDKDVINSIIQSHLADIQIETIDDFLFPENLIDFINESYKLTNTDLDNYAELELLFLKLSDRSTANAISVQNRRKYYFLLLNHFINILDKYNINQLLCFDTPHSFFSSLLYHLALKKNISIIRIEYHYFSNYCLVVNTPQFPKIPENYRKDDNEQILRDSLSLQLLAQLNNKSSFAESYIVKEQKKLTSVSILGEGKMFFQFLFKYISNIIIGLFPFIYKKHIHHFTSLTGKKSELRYRVDINKALIKLYQLNKHYKKIAQESDLSVPYIYYGMHMQPEKTTTPLGGHFDNQLAAITILSQSLPNGWKLLVKEHPNQFNFRKVANQSVRDIYFYKAIQKLANVELVSLNLPSSELIKKARMVATITGTLGWESLMAGKPALVFGDAYYRACTAVGNISDLSSCKAEILRLSEIDAKTISKAVLRYLAYYHEMGIIVEASNWESKVNHSSLERKDQIKNLIESINNFSVE